MEDAFERQGDMSGLLGIQNQAVVFENSDGWQPGSSVQAMLESLVRIGKINVNFLRGGWRFCPDRFCQANTHLRLGGTFATMILNNCDEETSR